MRYLTNPALHHHPHTPGHWQGNPFSDREFQYEREPFRPEWRKVLKMIFSSNPQRSEKKADEYTPVVVPATDYLQHREADWCVWLGHACFLLQLNGLRFLTDPQLTDMPFVPRRVFPPFSFEDIQGVDYLLLSHDHRDHVDEKCIRTICQNNNIRKVLCPLKLTDVIGDWVGDTPIEEAAWYQMYATEGTGVRITFLPSRHWCRRGLTDFNRVLWGSFMLEVLGGGAQDAEQVDGAHPTARHTLYFGGDSAQTAYWKEIGRMFPGIDIAMLGIGAYKPEYMMRENHANPAEAFQGFLDLGARQWLPMHYGTYDLSNEPPSEPITWATELMRNAGRRADLLDVGVNQPVYLTNK